MTTSTDASGVRLSEHFLLSDLLGCDSIYRNGFPNVFEDATGRKLKEGRTLCVEALEPLLAHSRLSVAYGHISHDLSARIVKYQDPAKPSYHRWDAGAACDVVLHERIAADEPPVVSAFWIDENLPVSRVITYSESPFICVGTRVEEIRSGDHRRALYENRYIGERKPKYISYADTPATRRKQKDDAVKAVVTDPEHDWRGAGYPTYHGGGREQLQHIRTSEFTVMTDFLYSDYAVREGFANIPPSRRSYPKFKRAGALYDEILKSVAIRRMSIVRAYESPEWSESVHNWTKGIYLVFIPPASVHPDDVAHAASQASGVFKVLSRNGRVSVASELP